MATKNPALDLLTGARAAAPAASAATPLPEGVLRPGELLARAKANVEHLARAGDVHVVGEIGGFRKLNNGHWTFDLKDPRAANVKLPCIVWFNDTRRIKFELRTGQQVVVSGKPSVTEWATVQLRVVRVEPVGEGAHDLAFRQLKEKLEAEGLFAQERKRPLPRLPRTVGVVTSPQGAAIRDVLKVLFARMPGLHVIVAPTKVQGDSAASEIADAIRRLDRSGLCDLLLVVRGGGSQEDLWSFNTEPVVRAIANTSVPVISGVGHQVDVTLADLVADLRAATPSNAAELAVPRKEDELHRIDALKRRLLSSLKHAVADGRTRLTRAQKRLVDPRHIVDKRRRQVSELEQRLERALRRRAERERAALLKLEERLRARSPARAVAERRARLAAVAARLGPAIDARRARFGRSLAVLVARVDGISPLKVLARGYAIARRREDGVVVRLPADAPAGTRLEIILEAQATVRATVDGDDDDDDDS